jgi:L-rhamnose mutarotase
MKVSQRHFKKFQAEFNLWVERIGLKDYRIFFKHEGRNEFASVEVDEDAKHAVVCFAAELVDKYDQQLLDPARSAKHEAIHLLLHRLVWLGQCRYVRPDDFAEEWERLVRILEKVL